MNRLIALLCCAILAEPVLAQDKTNKQAADKKMKGDERKGFMSSCLKG